MSKSEMIKKGYTSVQCPSCGKRCFPINLLPDNSIVYEAHSCEHPISKTRQEHQFCIDVKGNYFDYKTLASIIKQERSPFTPQEQEVIDLLVEAHNKYVEIHKGSVTQDWVTAIHACQKCLFHDVVQRDYPEYFSKSN